MQILTLPNPILSKASILVEDIEKEVLPFVREMRQLLLGRGGLGLSAIQVGIEKAFFIDRSEVYINPILTILDPTEVEGREGCLSIPGGIYVMKRFRGIKLDYTNQKGSAVSNSVAIPNKILSPKDQLALVKCLMFQHEMDHIGGKTLADLGKPYLGQFGRIEEEKEKRVDPRTLPVMDLRTLQHYMVNARKNINTGE